MKDLTLVREETEMDLKQIAGGRSVCIDVTGVDSNGKYYDLEIQRADKGAGAHRIQGVRNATIHSDLVSILI